MAFPPTGFGPFAMPPPGFIPDRNMIYLTMERTKSEAKHFMDNNQFEHALQLYTSALEMTNLLPGIGEEVAKLLSNRSLVFTKLGRYDEALEDAENCMTSFPNWTKGYWRAAQAHKLQNKYIEALPYLLTGLVVMGPSATDEDIITFMTDIVCIMPFITHAMCSEELLEQINMNLMGMVECPRIMTKLVHRVVSKVCWIGVALLVLGTRNGIETCLDQSAATCSMEGISISSLLLALSVSEKQNYGIKLAVHLMKYGAQVTDIEEKLEHPLAHIGVHEALLTGVIDLLRYFVEKCLKADGKKSVCDAAGNSVFHVLVKSGKASTTIGETIMRLLLNHGFRPFQTDVFGKLPIQYLDPKEHAYSLLSNSMRTIDEDTKQRIAHLKMQGNKATSEKNLEEALKYYSEALVLTHNIPQLSQDAAVLLSNRSFVQSGLGRNEEALADSQASILCDPKWNKGYWRKGQVLMSMKRYAGAFDAFLDGYKAANLKQNFLMEALIAVSLFQDDAIQKDKSYEQLMSVDRQEWPQVICQLAKNAEWKAIALLVEERVTGDRSNQEQSLVAGLSMKDVPLTSLLPYLERRILQKESTYWAHEIAVTFVKNGSQLQSLKQNNGDTPLHVAIQICLLTGQKDLLELLLAQVSRNARTLLDGRGDSVFHVIVRYMPSVSQQIREVLARVLLQDGFDPNQRDLNDRLAIDYVAEQCELNNMLLGYTRADSDKHLSDEPTSNAKTVKEQGNEAFNRKDFVSAIKLYSKAINLMLNVCMEGSEDEHGLAVLYSNRAECFLKTGKNSEALQDAMNSVSCDGHWYKAHMRVGWARIAMGDLDLGLKAFSNAYNSLDTTASDRRKCEILLELITAKFKSGKGKNASQVIDGLPDIPCHLWAMVAYDLVCNDSWDPAALAFMQYTQQKRSPCRLVIDLKPLCNRNKIRTEDWALEMIQYFLECGSNFTTLTVYSGDKYFHATVQLTLLSGVVSLLIHVLNAIVKRLGDEDLQDECGNTVLHIVTKDTSVKEDFRQTILLLLIQANVNPLHKNFEGRWPIEYVPDHERGNISLLNLSMEATRIAVRENLQSKQNQPAQSRFSKNRQKEPAKKQSSSSQQPYNDNNSSLCDKCEEYLVKATDLVGEKRSFQALDTLSNILHNNHKNESHKRLADKVIEMAIKIIREELNPDIPDKLLKVPEHLLQKIVIGLAQLGKWRQMEVVVQRAKTIKGRYFLSEFGKQLSLIDLVSCSSLKSAEDSKLNILEMLIKNKATVKDSKELMMAAVSEEHYKVVHFLLSHGVDCCHLTLEPGDTPTHAALAIALYKDKGNFKILELLLEKFDKEPSNVPSCDPELVDCQGDTLLHMVSKTKYTGTALKATEMLCKRDLAANVTNKEGKLPVHYITKKNDRRLQFLKLAMASGASKSQKQPEKKVSVKKSDELKETLPESDPKKLDSKTPEKHVKIKQISQKEICKRKIDQSIRELPDYFYSIFEPSKKLTKKECVKAENCTAESLHDGKSTVLTEKQSEKGGEDVGSGRKLFKENNDLDTTGEVARSIVKEKEERIDNEDVKKDTATVEDGDPDDDDDDDDEEVQDEDIALDAQMFDNLEWEVECTADVWKALQDSKIPPDMKQRAVRKLLLLARGEWHPHLCRPVRQTPANIKLFQSKLSKGCRILWELAVAFSPRCSETAEHLLLSSVEELDKQPVRGGRMYSEIIRVWDIVFDHNKLYRSVKNIVKSHNRGETCIIQKKLKGIKQKQFLKGIHKRYPMLFAESNAVLSESQLEDCQRDWQDLYPPASSNETEYHILKFYSFSSNLVSHILQNLEIKVDFPFRVTDLEHAIINLKSTAPILLLGRSGTGKTTCCLYRLWSQFVSYWTKATIADAPLLPRNIEFQHDVEEELSEEKTDNEDEDCVRDEEEDIVTSILGAGAAPELCDADEDQCTVGEKFDHLHQIFITKNAVLCTEVKKNFVELSHAFDLSKKHTALEQENVPNRLKDVDEFRYPLFVNSKQLLMMLDASLPPPYFFDRKDDGSLKVEIRGWTDTDAPLGYLPVLDYDSDAEDDEDEEKMNEFDEGLDADDIHDARQVKVKVDPRREITYEVFADEIWPHINKRGSKYHPTLIWTEILSFIKGSFEALAKSTGHLTKEEYLELGRKRAPNFSGERNKIFDLFSKYNHFKKQNFFFDETDLVFNIYKRLKHIDRLPWVIHQIFVDETQDFTQAELCLLIRICQTPNQMFLTGDTAQSIMRGISFRFSDLRSLFFYARKSMHAINNSTTVEVPKQVYQLTHNYRSHAGILCLASSILDVLMEFFPESFDKLHKDQGLFNGPNPILLESCSFSDLAVLLRGNKRKTSHIEFGAHQAILVVDEAARENIPEELRLGLVLTIYEAKGLEFDDVLVYNFFKDSPAVKEWRVITDFLNRLADESTVSGENECSNFEESLVEIDHDVIQQAKRPRPLTFDPNLHKVLNSELKHLYTAVTRARVNVWIFDEDMEKRAPMFEYFKARKLVRSLTLAEDDDISLTGTVFAEKSSIEEWLQRGDDFMKHFLYKVAAKCYAMGGATDKEKVASAHQTALEASRMRDRPRLMQEEFLYAAEKYLECNLLQKAAICLQNAREREMAALLCEKCGQLERAAETYRRLKKPVEGSRCFEQLGWYNRAVEMLYYGELFDMALDSLHRYKMLVQDLKQQGKVIPEVLQNNVPDPNYSEETLSYKSAELFHRYKNKPKMLEALDRLPNIMDRVDFLKRKGYLEHAARILEENGNSSQAAEMLQENGMFQEAITCARRSRDDSMIAKSLLLRCHVSMTRPDSDWETLIEEAREALLIFQTRKDLDMEGEAYLILADLEQDDENVRDYVDRSWIAFGKSKPLPNAAGQIAVTEWNMEHIPQKIYKFFEQAIKTLEHLMTVIKILHKSEKPQEKEQVKKVIKFFGLKESAEDKTFVLHPKQKPRYLTICKIEFQKGIVSVEKNDAYQQISLHLLHLVMSWCASIQEAIFAVRYTAQQCPKYVDGYDCKDNQDGNCSMLHIPYTSATYMELFNANMRLIRLDQVILEGAKSVSSFAQAKSLLKEEAFKLLDYWKQEALGAELFLDDLFPCHIHHRMLTEKDITAHKFLNAIRMPFVKLRIGNFLMAQLEQMPLKEKMKTTSIFVKIIFLSKLLQLPLDTKSIMTKYESELAEEFSSRKLDYWKVKSKICRYALICDQIQRETIIQCLAQRFLDAFHYLSCASSNPCEALIKFTKFTKLLGPKNKLRMLPDYGQFFFWLEVFTTVSFFLMAKINHQREDFCFFLPGSYLATINFVDGSFDTGRQSIQEGIQNSQPYSNQAGLIQDRLRSLLGILCGYKIKLNLLKDIFRRKERGDKYSVAERLLVLCLCLICNVGKSVAIDCESGLMGAIASIELEDHAPNRLKQAVQEVQCARGLVDVASALKDLLRKREEDTLFVCYWKWELKQRQGVQAKPLRQLSNFPSDFLCPDTLETMKKASILKFEGQSNIDEDDEQEEPVMTHEEKMKYQEEQKALHQQQKEDRAVKVLVRFFRVVLMKRKLKHLPELKAQMEESDRQNFFDSFVIDDAMCGICGIDFVVHQVGDIEGKTDTGDSASYDIDEVSGNVMSVEKYPEKTKLVQTLSSRIKLDHEQSQNHVQKMLEFRGFRNLYKNSVSAKLQEVYLFIQKYELTSDQSDEMYPYMQFKIRKLIRCRNTIKHEMQRIMDSRDWGTRQLLMSTNYEMHNSYNAVEHYVKENYKENAYYHRSSASATSSSTQQAGKNWNEELLDVVDQPDLNPNFETRRNRKKTYRGKKQ